MLLYIRAVLSKYPLKKPVQRPRPQFPYNIPVHVWSEEWALLLNTSVTCCKHILTGFGVAFQNIKSRDQLVVFGRLCTLACHFACASAALYTLISGFGTELSCVWLCLSLDLESLPISIFLWETQLCWQVTGIHTWACIRAQMEACTVAAGEPSP